MLHVSRHVYIYIRCILIFWLNSKSEMRIFISVFSNFLHFHSFSISIPICRSTHTCHTYDAIIFCGYWFIWIQWTIEHWILQCVYGLLYDAARCTIAINAEHWTRWTLNMNAKCKHTVWITTKNEWEKVSTVKSMNCRRRKFVSRSSKQ